MEINKIAKHLLGRTWDELTAVPGVDALVDGALKEQKYGKLRIIGRAIEDGSDVTFSEAELENHIHILGAPGEGKSKFIELQALQTLNRGYPCCVLDGSDHGDTAYKIFKRCVRAGFNKVLLIDPLDFIAFKKVPVINPFGPSDDSRYSYPLPLVRRHIADIVRVLWGQAFDVTPRITKYVKELVTALHTAHLTLYDVKYFFDRSDEAWADIRSDILAHLPQYLKSVRLSLTNVYRTRWDWTEFESTIRRLDIMHEEPVDLIVGSLRQHIDFPKLVADGWIILVNLDEEDWGQEQQRLIGTLIINEVIRAVSILRRKSWDGRFYFYIDEAGDYATPKLARILSKKRKSGFRFCLAHQHYSQFEERNVLEAIQALTKIKVLFQTPSRPDRDRMIRDMYGGDIPDRQVSFVLSELQKQHAAIKINKQHPHITRLKDLADIQVTNDELQSFKAELYSQPWFHSLTDVRHEINARFKQVQSGPSLSKRASDSRPLGATIEPGLTRKNQRSSKARTISDHSSSGKVVLLGKKGRSTRKVNPIPTKTK